MITVTFNRFIKAALIGCSVALLGCIDTLLLDVATAPVANATPTEASDPVEPDPKFTPGDIVRVPVEVICAPGYTKQVRNVNEAEKRAVFIEYFGALPANPGDYEIDHLISLELGGSNDIKNLWPQTYKGEWNARIKRPTGKRV